MAVCARLDSNNFVQAFTPPDGQCQHYMLVTAQEFADLTLSQALNIDTELYVLVSGYILASFVSGHVLGRIVRTFGRG